ncbi:4Fe-4S dicluster domain-containing protein [bacterium]|nr:4Fe-4S dicluster domain-containing protein [bacterium]
MKYPKLRELKEVVKSLFSKPYTSKFPFQPHEAFDGFRGKPEYFDEYCIGCGACAEVCPANAIKRIDPPEPVKDENESPVRKMELRYDMCNFCGNCQAHCITEKGIQLTKQFDLALFDRKLAVEEIEKELIICDLCGTILTAKDHLCWLIRRLGTLAYGNPTLLLTSQRELIPVESGAKTEQFRRPDIFKVLCPKCRHEIMLKDIWG